MGSGRSLTPHTVPRGYPKKTVVLTILSHQNPYCNMALQPWRGTVQRVPRLAGGQSCDVEPVGAGISELRTNCGSGYRVYFFRGREANVLLLCRDDKRSQAADIKRRIGLAAQWQEHDHGVG